MSEWFPCQLCGHERENMCACINPKCSDYVPVVVPAAPAPKAGDLVDRLRGKYTVQINDGAGPLDGKTEMTRDFSAFIPPINLEAAHEIETLRRWKAEQLTVTAWWQAIDDYVRKSPDAPLGANVSAIALQWLQQRRGILETIEALETVLVTWRTDLAAIPDHLPFGSDSRDKIAAIIKQIDELLPPTGGDEVRRNRRRQNRRRRRRCCCHSAAVGRLRQLTAHFCAFCNTHFLPIASQPQSCPI